MKYKNNILVLLGVVLGIVISILGVFWYCGIMSSCM